MSSCGARTARAATRPASRGAGSTRRAGGELARTSLQRGDRGDARFLAALGAAADDPAATRERLTFHGAWGHAYWHSAGLPTAPSWLQEEGALRRAALVDRHVRTLSDLGEAARLLDAAGVRWLTFKGPVLSELSYPRSDLRGYADLDLLVDPDDLGAAVGALSGAGWPLVDPLHDIARRPLAGEVHLLGRAGTPVDLHWHLFYRAERRDRTTVDPRSVVALRQAVRLGGSTVPTLPTASHLVYVCAHAAAAGAHRLRWLADVMRLCSTPGLDWDQVVRVARQWTAARSTALVLHRSRELLGATVPREVLRALEPSRTWVAVERLATAVHPLVSGTDRMSLTASIARQGDDDLSAAWVRLLGAAAERRGGRLPLRSDDTASLRSDDTASLRSDDPRSALDLPDGPRLVRDYVRDVRAWRLPGQPA